MMKKLLFSICMLASLVAFSQSESGFGLKAGLNYNSNGDLIAESLAAADDIKEGADSKVGFHIGAFAKLDFPKIYLRPELVFTKTKSDYDGADFDMSKLDLPVLLGYKIIGPLSVFAGPSFQYILNSDLDLANIQYSDVKNDFTVGLNVGLAAHIGNLGFDIRYERGFSKNEADFIINNAGDATPAFEGRIDSRPSQLILSVSVKL